MKSSRPKKPVSRTPGKGRAAGKRSSKLPLALGIVLFAGLVVWSFKRPPTEVPATTLSAKAGEPKIIENQKQLTKMQKAGHQRAMQLVVERAAGLEPVPLRKEKGRPPALKVDVKSFTRGCIPGDLDIIRQDMEFRASSNPQLVLSLEPLDARSEIKPIQKNVSLTELSQGFSTQFVLEPMEERNLMGLFLCSARKGEGCAGQERPSMSELGALQNEIRFGRRPAGDYQPGNKTYFFLFLVAYPDRLLIHDPQQSLESSQKRLEVAMAKGGQPVSPLLMTDVMNRLRAAGSLPAIVQSESVRIQLPYKEARCP
ncbi:hypothetical protein [Oligoflexus tunisiensis]|uniref:hypothetical protein n=1 Tax=Oligoflexus tunisiensis TaxID=708132 RepID=UPI00114D380A|nr:hypothetical protein [Oligoflexus tunisiensis]